MNEFLGPLTIIAVVYTARASGLLLEFVFFYPLFMSWIWMAGGLYFYFHWERKSAGPNVLPDIPQPAPLVSILVPCFNEGDNVGETIAGLAAQNYPNIEIIAINDGSKDETGAKLDALTLRYPQLRVIHHASRSEE